MSSNSLAGALSTAVRYDRPPPIPAAQPEAEFEDIAEVDRAGGGRCRRLGDCAGAFVLVAASDRRCAWRRRDAAIVLYAASHGARQQPASGTSRDPGRRTA